MEVQAVKADELLLQAIAKVSSQDVGRALDERGANADFFLPQVNGSALTPLRQLAQALPLGDDQRLERGRFTSEADYAKELRAIGLALAEYGANFIRQDGWKLRPADYALLRTPETGVVENAAQIVLHTVFAFLAARQPYHPDLRSFFLDVGTSRADREGESCRSRRAAFVHDVFTRVARRLQEPEEHMDRQLGRSLSREEKGYWRYLGRETLNPRRMPYPSQQFLETRAKLESLERLADTGEKPASYCSRSLVHLSGRKTAPALWHQLTDASLAVRQSWLAMRRGLGG